jgi:hypothetical protein
MSSAENRPDAGPLDAIQRAAADTHSKDEWKRRQRQVQLALIRKEIDTYTAAQCRSALDMHPDIRVALKRRLHELEARKSQ